MLDTVADPSLLLCDGGRHCTSPPSLPPPPLPLTTLVGYHVESLCWTWLLDMVADPNLLLCDGGRHCIPLPFAFPCRVLSSLILT